MGIKQQRNSPPSQFPFRTVRLGVQREHVWKKTGPVSQGIASQAGRNGGETGRGGAISVSATTECILQSHFRLAVTALYVTRSYCHPSRFPEPTVQYRAISLVLICFCFVLFFNVNTAALRRFPIVVVFKQWRRHQKTEERAAVVVPSKQMNDQQNLPPSVIWWVMSMSASSAICADVWPENAYSAYKWNLYVCFYGNLGFFRHKRCKHGAFCVAKRNGFGWCSPPPPPPPPSKTQQQSTTINR